MERGRTDIEKGQEMQKRGIPWGLGKLGAEQGLGSEGTELLLVMLFKVFLWESSKNTYIYVRYL